MPSQSPPPADRADLLAAIGEAGLLTAAQFARAAASISPATTTAEQTAEYLVATGVLTRFQADRLLAGRTDGFVLGHYVIQEQVGRGSAGRVYKALHRTMNRPVAVKVLNAELTQAAETRQAFQREVRAAARLNHPNIVTAYDANEVGDRSYLVTEFVDGPTAEAMVRERGPLPVAEACEIVRQVAVGLQHAHELGMVHRDLKPANLLVARASKTLPGCVVKIADFGMARLVASAQPRSGRLLVGTADYVAPEQATNPQHADHRADLYSLGCVLYHLLAGRPPFAGGTTDAKVSRHQFEPPAPVEWVRTDVPPAVAEVVARLLAKDPNARYQSAAAVASRLDGLAAEAVVVEEEGGMVNFDLPAVPPGQFSFTSGCLTGMHATDAQPSGGQVTLSVGPPRDAQETATSPWSQLTDEVLRPDEVLDGPTIETAPVARPIKSAPVGRRGASAAVLALCGTAVVGCAVALGYILQALAR
jgi:serine/threonine-protein kinase